MKSVIIAKHILQMGKVIATGNFAKTTSSGCFLKKDHLVINCTTIMLGMHCSFAVLCSKFRIVAQAWHSKAMLF